MPSYWRQERHRWQIRAADDLLPTRGILGPSNCAGFRRSISSCFTSFEMQNYVQRLLLTALIESRWHTPHCAGAALRKTSPRESLARHFYPKLASTCRTSFAVFRDSGMSTGLRKCRAQRLHRGREPVVHQQELPE